jgi:hypothetical protein
MIFIAAAEIDSIRGVSMTRRVANAQAMFEMFWAYNSALLLMAAEASAVNRGWCVIKSVAIAQAVLAMS